MAMLRRANAWRGAGADAGGDVNGDGRLDGDDALVMYYAYTLRQSVGRRGDGRRGAVSADAAGRPGREFRPERLRAGGDAAQGERPEGAAPMTVAGSGASRPCASHVSLRPL